MGGEATSQMTKEKWEEERETHDVAQDFWKFLKFKREERKKKKKLACFREEGSRGKRIKFLPHISCGCCCC